MAWFTTKMKMYQWKKTFCYELMFMHMLNIDSGCGRKCSVDVRDVMGVVILRLVGAVSMAVLFHIWEHVVIERGRGLRRAWANIDRYWIYISAPSFLLSSSQSPNTAMFFYTPTPQEASQWDFYLFSLFSLTFVDSFVIALSIWSIMIPSKSAYMEQTIQGDYPLTV